MGVEGQVARVEAYSSSDQGRDAAIVTTGERAEPLPEQTMMDDDEIGTHFDSRANRRFRRVHRRSDRGDDRGSFDLESVEGGRVVGMVGHSQVLLQVLDHGF
jgi:hypothetical protein